MENLDWKDIVIIEQLTQLVKKYFVGMDIEQAYTTVKDTFLGDRELLRSYIKDKPQEE